MLVLPLFIGSMFISSSLLLLSFFISRSFLRNDKYFQRTYEKMESQNFYNSNVLYCFRTLLGCYFDFLKFFRDSVYDGVFVYFDFL